MDSRSISLTSFWLLLPDLIFVDVIMIKMPMDIFVLFKKKAVVAQ